MRELQKLTSYKQPVDVKLPLVDAFDTRLAELPRL
jgi:hypothetical protein